MAYYYPRIKFGRAKAPRKEGHIKKSDKWLQQKYCLFNKRYWSGTLPWIPVYFRGKPHSTHEGYCYAYSCGSPEGITVNGYNHEKRVMQILLHEMVHVEQFHSKKKADHGRYFKSRCRELTILTKEKYGVIK